MRKVKVAVFLMGLSLGSGCGIARPSTKSSAKLPALQTVVTKQDLEHLLGKPDRVLNVSKLDSGKWSEIDEYGLYAPHTGLLNALMCPFSLTVTCWYPVFSPQTPYRFEFIDGHLARWGLSTSWDPDVSGNLYLKQK